MLVRVGSCWIWFGVTTGGCSEFVWLVEQLGLLSSPSVCRSAFVIGLQLAALLFERPRNRFVGGAAPEGGWARRVVGRDVWGAARGAGGPVCRERTLRMADGLCRPVESEFGTALWAPQCVPEEWGLVLGLLRLGTNGALSRKCRLRFGDSRKGAA